ncbi:hypothetical protein [Mucilaginibacter psychrotolerans]|uniref:Uncharacterized protein n=1 Tax=Mucilaginibacter psychrotolerans TaxID=1524096 RepID=A0A4Y8S907_9SPHI|nr:hypothetical protein [Mucilaginibacter psychrotolerans]TFF35141.1 hypothetical protein E2R66_19445 [Mucilaginibacter psychrotolerans]
MIFLILGFLEAKDQANPLILKIMVQTKNPSNNRLNPENPLNPGSLYRYIPAVKRYSAKWLLAKPHL